MHRQIRGLNYRKIARILKYFGFKFVNQTGSHEHWKDNFGNRVELVAGQGSYFIKTLKSMIHQSGRSEKEWLRALDEI